MSRHRKLIVTGAASGIGAAVVRRVAGPGMGLTLHARRASDRLDTVAQAAREKGAEVETVVGDLAEPGVAASIAAAHAERFGALDHLVANAGFALAVPFEDMTAEEIGYAFRGNTQSFFELVQGSLSMLRASPCGRVVALGSFTSRVFRTDMPQFPASAASKGALEVAVRSLAVALAKDGVTVNCVVPGYIEKDPGTSRALDAARAQQIASQIPLGRLGRADEVAAMICFLLSEAAGYVTGQSIAVDGGL